MNIPGGITGKMTAVVVIPYYLSVYNIRSVIYAVSIIGYGHGYIHRRIYIGMCLYVYTSQGHIHIDKLNGNSTAFCIFMGVFIEIFGYCLVYIRLIKGVSVIKQLYCIYIKKEYFNCTADN